MSKPDYDVSVPVTFGNPDPDAPDGEKLTSWKKIGVAFQGTRTNDNAICIKLHALPIGGEMYLFPYEPPRKEGTMIALGWATVVAVGIVGMFLAVNVHRTLTRAGKRNRELTLETEALRRLLAEAQCAAITVCPWCRAYMDNTKRARS